MIESTLFVRRTLEPCVLLHQNPPTHAWLSRVAVALRLVLVYLILRLDDATHLQDTRRVLRSQFYELFGPVHTTSHLVLWNPLKGASTIQ